MPRQESLVEERYRAPSSTMSPYAMRLMAEALSGVEEPTTVDRFCRVFLAGIQGLSLSSDFPPSGLSICASPSTRAYLAANKPCLKDVLGEDWPTAKLSRIEERWKEISAQHSVCFVSVSVHQVPKTALEAGTAFRVWTERGGNRTGSADTDSYILAFRTGGLRRLPRPEMEPPYVAENWVALTALLAASRQGRTVELGDPAFSQSFHLSVDGDLVCELLTDARATATAVSPIDEDGLRALGREANSTFSAILNRAKSEAKTGSMGSLVEAVLDEQIYPEEDVLRLRYLKLWQALVDAGETNKLGNIAGLKAHDTKNLDDVRNRIGHPAGLRRGYGSERAFHDLKKAALSWVRALGQSSN